MVDAINGLIETVMASPWALLAIFLVCAVDAFFPVVPGETTVIAGGALAATGGQNLLWVVALAAVGAAIGDHVSYAIGRLLGARAVERVLRGKKGHAARLWAENQLRTRGGLMIVAARFVPGGRTATTFAAGTLHYPLSRFTGFVAVAATLWAMYGGFIGYFAGELFRGNHLLAVTLGICLSVAISIVTEVVRYLLRRRRGGTVADPASDVATRSPGAEQSAGTHSAGSVPIAVPDYEQSGGS